MEKRSLAQSATGRQRLCYTASEEGSMNVVVNRVYPTPEQLMGVANEIGRAHV